MTISSQAPSSQTIQTMFDDLAPRYDLFNHLTSAGLAVLWRQEALKPLKLGMSVLDIGCGTGDLSLEALKRVGSRGEVTGLDFSENMLKSARSRYEKAGGSKLGNLELLHRKAEELPLAGRLFDRIISGFVLRNIYENIDSILKGVYASLKHGGEISFLDITEPRNAFVRGAWHLYMNTLVWLYGKILFGKKYPVLYLTQSAHRFLKTDEFSRKLKETGFIDLKVKVFMSGVISLYQAKKA